MHFKTLVVILVAFILGGALWTFRSEHSTAAPPALADLRIDNLTCGSCVENINRALEDLPGVGAADINVTAGRGRIEFDPTRTRAEAIADRITAAGYPSRVEMALSSTEYLALRNEDQSLEKLYVARVGGRLLSRADFEARLQARGGAPADLWEELLPRELMLNAAETAGVVIHPGEVENRLNALRSVHPDFDRLAAARFGSAEILSRQVREELTIARFLEQKVIPADLPASERQEFLNRWYADLTAATAVTIFDPQLQPKSKTSGCACCGSKPKA